MSDKISGCLFVLDLGLKSTEDGFKYFGWKEEQPQTTHLNCHCGFVLHRTNLLAWLGHPWQKSKGGMSMSRWQGLGFLAGMEELAGGLAFWCHLDAGGVISNCQRVLPALGLPEISECLYP